MFKFSGHDINGNRHIGLLAESKGYKGQPEKGFYISNDAGSPWAYQVRAETVSPGIEFDGKWYFIGDLVTAVWYDYEEPAKETTGEIIFNKEWNCFCIWDEANKILNDLNAQDYYYWTLEKFGNKWDNPELEV